MAHLMCRVDEARAGDPLETEGPEEVAMKLRALEIRPRHEFFSLEHAPDRQPVTGGKPDILAVVVFGVQRRRARILVVDQEQGHGVRRQVLEPDDAALGAHRLTERADGAIPSFRISCGLVDPIDQAVDLLGRQIPTPLHSRPCS